MTTSATRGRPRQVAVKDLRLDPYNPRLPEAHRGGLQEDLAVDLELGFEAFAVAQSIADNGFFMGEPLLVIASDEEESAWIVIEGNRRLTALLGLTTPSIRAQFPNPAAWDALAERSSVDMDTLIPVVEHADRGTGHAEVARAHIVGKLPWRPYMQAKFIAARVQEGRTLAQVAELIGITKSKAADLYRDQAVAGQAERLGLPASEIEKAFSVLTVALGNTKLRSHIGAPLGSQLSVGTDPIPEEKTEELGELITWIFGDEDNEPLISDSRQMSQLGNVVASPVGLQSLRSGSTLEEAKQKVQQAGMQPIDRLTNRLKSGKNALLAASDDLSDFADDPRIRQLVEDIEAAAESLRTILNASGEFDGP